jgi:hypothetical protein
VHINHYTTKVAVIAPPQKILIKWLFLFIGDKVDLY